MSIIVPTVTVESADEYKAALEVLHGFASRVHIDIWDAAFAQNPSITTADIWWPKEWTVDIHAMVQQPADYVPALIALKPNMIVLHAEAGDIMPFIQQIKAAGIKAGVALLKPTVPSSIPDIIQAVDHVMVFSGNLGHHGGTASLMQLEKVRLIKAINPRAEIGWDGGISVENAYTLTQGGVDVLNVGGAISGSPNPADAYNKLVAETQKHGVL
jgi:ribulose-phosphate 3-epimerase